MLQLGNQFVEVVAPAQAVEIAVLLQVLGVAPTCFTEAENSAWRPAAMTLGRSAEATIPRPVRA
jgi:hypothetical protein